MHPEQAGAEAAAPDPKELIERVKRAGQISRSLGSTWHLDGAEAEDLAAALGAALARAEKAEAHLDLVASHWSPPSSCLIEEAKDGWWVRFYRCPDKGPHPTRTAALLAWVGWLELKRCLAQKKGGI